MLCLFSGNVSLQSPPAAPPLWHHPPPVRSIILTHLLLPSCCSFCFSKNIQINIIDDEEYEKNKNFFLEIGEPRLLEMSERKGGGVAFLCCDPAPITTFNLCLSKLTSWPHREEPQQSVCGQLKSQWRSSECRSQQWLCSACRKKISLCSTSGPNSSEYIEDSVSQSSYTFSYRSVSKLRVF